MVANASSVGDEAGAVQDEPAAVADPAPSGDAATETKDVQNIEAAPIQTRDGKHTIPYEVLANTRAAKEAAEAQAKAEADARARAEAQLAELQAKLDAAQAGAPGIAAADGVTLTPEELAEMQENFPVMAKAYQALQAELARVQNAATVQQKAWQATQQDEVARTVQDHIDSNPKLAHLQASDPVAWKRAVEIDDQLRSNPATASLPMAERFTKAAAAYEAIYGAINVPTTATKETPAAKTVDDVLAQAKPAAPRSLSDLPGGSAVASSEVGNLENMSGAEISNNLMAMSPKAREAYLNSLG
jgi:transglutaminase/protease-like cytokinesis protein 3